MLYIKLRKENNMKKHMKNDKELKAQEKKNAFNMDLNSANVGAVLTDSGRLFHSLGPTTALQARSWYRRKMTIL